MTSLPNVKELFLPDPGYIICDVDLDRADLQVVIAEADDEELRQALAAGEDLHQLNANILGVSRALAKAFVHGTNYSASPRTMATVCGITTAQADMMQKRWFNAHPGIRKWHEQTRRALQTTREVRNRFGFRRFFFDRIESIFPEALAWVPQSTVANVINKGFLNLDTFLPQVHILAQVHDSLVIQMPADQFVPLLPKIRNLLTVPIPYDPVLKIGVSIKASRKSWGDCKPIPWDFSGIL